MMPRLVLALAGVGAFAAPRGVRPNVCRGGGSAVPEYDEAEEELRLSRAPFNPYLEGRSDKDLGLYCLNAEKTDEDVKEAAWSLVYREDADPLALCMAAWSLSSRRVFEDSQLFEALAQGAAPRLQEIAETPRGPEALVNTARAFAIACQQTDVAPAALFSAIASAAGPIRQKFRSEHFALLSRSLAAAKATGLPVALPFGDAAPLATSRAIHATLQRHGFQPVDERRETKTNFKAFAVSDFVTETEAKILTRAVTWQRSLVHGDASARTSDTATLRGGDETVVARTVDAISARAAALFGLPRSNCESLQLVRYRDSSHYYVSHCDLLEDEDQLLVGGQRLGTVLIYLSTIPEGRGGETKFDALKTKVRPTFGTALVWCNVKPDGTPDLDSSHSALPLVDARPTYDESDSEKNFIEKIALNCWIRAFPGASDL